MKFIGSIITLCGLCIVLYGLILFIVMPAAGAFIVVAGMVCIVLGVKKQEQGIKKEQKGKGSIKEAFSNKGYKIAANIFFMTNLILISALMPKFNQGSELGFVVNALLIFTISFFYTAIILSLFRATIGIAMVTITTWAGFWLRAMH